MRAYHKKLLAGVGRGEWDLTNASYDSARYILAEDAETAIFNDDGTILYTLGRTSWNIFQHELSTAFDVRTATYSGNSFDASLLEINPEEIFFKPDGTTLYVVGSNINTVYQYTLSTPWDITTASYASKSFTTGLAGVVGLSFRDDGTAMYLLRSGVVDDVRQYSLSTAWDVSTASFASKDINVAPQESSPESVYFKSDGTKMYILGGSSDTVYPYSLGTAWDVSTASYDGSGFSVRGEETSASGLSFNNDGSKMYITGIISDGVIEYTLSTNWDITTSSHLSMSFDPPEEANLYGFNISPDGTKLYIVGADDTVYQYTLSTAWDITTASYDSLSFLVSQGTSPYSLQFKPDGTVVYILDGSDDTVYQYTLSTPWNISTTSYASKSKNVNTQDVSPVGLFISDDGTKMYVSGGNNTTLYQYTMATAWDVSTTSYDSVSLNVSAQETSPRGLFLKPDGTRLYVIGFGSDGISEYSLSTPWDISTASFLLFFGGVIETAPYDLFFKSDGTKLYTSGVNFDKIFEIDLV